MFGASLFGSTAFGSIVIISFTEESVVIGALRAVVLSNRQRATVLRNLQR